VALDDRQHVEAVAIMRRLVEGRYEPFGVDPETYHAANQWLKENHPEPSVYVAAMREASRTGGDG
jgi:hypothetical protein